jgi:hypothetical protein
MTIETKFKIGDDAWVLEKDSAWCGRVWKINTETNHTGVLIKETTTIVSYYISAGTFKNKGTFLEERLFHSKEELLKSL